MEDVRNSFSETAPIQKLATSAGADYVVLSAPRTCRICTKQFTENHDRACSYHPESYTGETAQRWMAPGETKDAAVVHNFYSCCGSQSREAPGCCWTRHVTFDEPESTSFRKPGMGIGD